MRLTEAQRNAFFEALPTTLGNEDILVFEDDGGGWHHDKAIESWVAWSLLSDGARYLFNIRSTLSETWNSDTSRIDDEWGQLEKGMVALYVCSTNKNKVQAYSSQLAGLIDRTRLGLSLDYEGITTGPEEARTRPLGSYSDLRLKKRVYRVLTEVPILYKFSVIESPPLIKRVELEPWMGYPLEEMEHLIIRAPLPLKADIALSASSSQSLIASIHLAA